MPLFLKHDTLSVLYAKTKSSSTDCASDTFIDHIRNESTWPSEIQGSTRSEAVASLTEGFLWRRATSCSGYPVRLSCHVNFSHSAWLNISVRELGPLRTSIYETVNRRLVHAFVNISEAFRFKLCFLIIYHPVFLFLKLLVPMSIWSGHSQQKRKKSCLANGG